MLHERHEQNEIETSVTRVRHERDTSATRTTRWRHERNFNNGTSENILAILAI